MSFITFEDAARRVEEALQRECPEAPLRFAHDIPSTHLEIIAYLLDPDAYMQVVEAAARVEDQFRHGSPPFPVTITVFPWNGEWPGNNNAEYYRKKREDYLSRLRGSKRADERPSGT